MMKIFREGPPVTFTVTIRVTPARYVLAESEEPHSAKHEFYLTAVPRPASVAFAALLGALAYVAGRLG